MHLRFQKWDIVVIVAVVLMAALVFTLFLPQKDASDPCAQIYQDGKLVKTIALTENQEFSVSGKYTNTITVHDGMIAITQSDCPGQDCVRCGWMDRAGRSIVCLPNGLEIRVVAGNSDVDFVVG